MEERREREDLKMVCLLPWRGQQVSRECLRDLEGDTKGWSGKEKIHMICWRWGQRGRGDHRGRSAMELGGDWKDGFGGGRVRI